MVPTNTCTSKIIGISHLNDKGNCKNNAYSNFSDRNPYSKRTILFIYCSQICASYVPNYFSSIFLNLQVKWKEIYLLSRKVSIDTNFCMLQYKIRNNILYLIKQLLIFNKKDTKLCSYCSLQDESTYQ